MNFIEKKTRKIKKYYASNQQHILADFGLNQDTYNNHWLDAGRLFVEHHYPQKNAAYASYRQMILKDRQYWVWWLTQWKNHEHYFIVYKKDFDKAFSLEEYLMYMNELLYDQKLELSFFNQYINNLTLIKNGSNRKNDR